MIGVFRTILNHCEIFFASIIIIGSVPVRGSYYGNTSAEILLDDVICSGSEISLLDCAHSPLGTHDCDPHTELAGVRCKGECTITYHNLADDVVLHTYSNKLLLQHLAPSLD